MGKSTMACESISSKMNTIVNLTIFLGIIFSVQHVKGLKCYQTSLDLNTAFSLATGGAAPPSLDDCPADFSAGCLVSETGGIQSFACAPEIPFTGCYPIEGQTFCYCKEEGCNESLETLKAQSGVKCYQGGDGNIELLEWQTLVRRRWRSSVIPDLKSTQWGVLRRRKMENCSLSVSVNVLGAMDQWECLVSAVVSNKQDTASSF